MSSPQFTLFSHAGGPNGWKIVFLLKALGLTYETKYLDFAKVEQKDAAHTKFNPNGRIPTLVDHHNSDFSVWESDAILLYLVATYDKSNKFGGSTPNEVSEINQWLFFQSSGQGAYFGQAAHFKMFAPEKIPYAVERYTKEVARVCEVMEGVLSKQKFLVGNRVTIADLSFIPWNNFALAALLPDGVDAKVSYPSLSAWHNSLCALPYVAAGMADKAAL